LAWLIQVNGYNLKPLLAVNYKMVNRSLSAVSGRRAF